MAKLSSHWVWTLGQTGVTSTQSIRVQLVKGEGWLQKGVDGVVIPKKLKSKSVGAGGAAPAEMGVYALVNEPEQS